MEDNCILTPVIPYASTIFLQTCSKKVWLRTDASLVSEQACAVKTSPFPPLRSKVWFNFQRKYLLFNRFEFQYILLSPQRIRVSVSPQHNTVEYAATNDATTKECYNEQFLSIKSVCYNKRCYNERMLQRAVLINKIGMLQQTMLQRKYATTNAEEYYRPT
jgi:hypothetical protein